MDKNCVSLKKRILITSDLEKILQGKSKKRKLSHIHNLLDEDEWNLGKINQALKTCSSPNEENEFGQTPLIRVLEHANCSLEIINILLTNGADVNLKARCLRSPLISALIFCKQEVIECLMKAGGDRNQRYLKQSLLCIAVQCSEINIIKLLLKFECPLTRCKMHTTALECALSGRAESSSEAFKLFFEKGMKEKLYHKSWPEIMCATLKMGSAWQVKLLLKAGASLDNCKTHESSLFCVGCNANYTLKADVVKILLNAGADVFKKNYDGHIPLQRFLYMKPHEVDAIKLVIEKSKISIDEINNCNLLHGTLYSCFCKIDVIKILLEMGTSVSKRDKEGNIPLHVAVKCSSFNIIKLLLTYHLMKKAPVDVPNLKGETPMDVVLDIISGDVNLVTIMLVAGAQIGLKSIKSAIDSYTGYTGFNNQDKWDCLLLVVKICLLKNPGMLSSLMNLVITKGIQIVPFLNECSALNTYMDEIDGGALKRFIIGAKAFPRDRSYDLNEILRLKLYKKFSIYYDVISARIGKAAMLKKLVHTRVFQKQGEKVLSLNYDILSKVYEFVPEKYMLNFCHAAELGPENAVGGNSAA